MTNCLFTPEELAELARFDAEVDASPAYDAEEVKSQRERDMEIQDERLTPQQLRKRKSDRAYYQRNKERIVQRNAEYAAAHADSIREYRTRYFAENAESIKERRAAYRTANAKDIAEYQRQYHQDHREEHLAYFREYRAEHLEEERERSKRWREANRERYLQIKREYWARRKNEINAQRRAKSTRHTIYLTHDGRTQTITQWATELGIKRGTLASRIERGWDVERAFTTPV